MNRLIAPMEPVTLVVDGTAHEGWTQISISRALDRAAGDFTLGLTDKRQGPEGVTVPPRLYCGAQCRVYIGNDLVLTGYIDEVCVSYGANDHSIKVTGRSKTCDLVDCSVDPAFSGGDGDGGKQKPIRGLFHKEGEISRMVHGRPSPTAGLSAVTQPAGPAAANANGGHFRGQRLARIASMLARPYGIDVQVSGDSGEPFSGLTVEKGDKVFDVIERMCRLRGLLASDDAYGHLILARPGAGRACGTLELGKTILAADGRFSVKERYSEYRVFGQSPGLHRDSFGAVSDEDERADPDDEDGEDEPSAAGPSVGAGRSADIAERAQTVASAQGGARDDSVTRHRLLVVQAETAAEAGGVQARAQWEAAHRLGKSLSLTYTAPGWRTADGTIWETNGVVWLIDPLMELARSLVIGGVDFSLDESGGMVTKLSLSPQEAYLPEPLKAKKPKSGGGRGSDGLFSARGPISRQVSGQAFGQE